MIEIYINLLRKNFLKINGYSSLKQMVENQNFNDAEEYFRKVSQKIIFINRLREALGLDVKISIKDLLLYTFGFILK